MSASLPLVITIDGLAATGKTAVAVALSQQLGWQVLYSGMLYRYLAYSIQQEGCADDLSYIPKSWEAKLSSISCRLDKGVLHTYVGTIDMGYCLAHESVGSLASIIARNKDLRNALLPIQRAYRVQPGLIAEGRDMSSVVFPDACLKVFLKASESLRAKRRYEQLKASGKDATMADIIESLRERDERDMQRALASQEGDVKIIDTSTCEVDEVVSMIMADLQLRTAL